MQKLLIAAAVLIASSAGAAFAGCSNYVEPGSHLGPAPRATVCFGGKCEKTTIETYCANAHGAQTTYANGWHVEYGAPDETKPGSKETVSVYRVLKPEEYSKLACKEIDEGACNFPPRH